MSADATNQTTNDAVPDERFWVKYSPHQEFPISGLTSIALHLVAGVLLLLLFSFVLNRANDTSMPVDAITLGDDINAGGGGDPNGTAVTNIPGSNRTERPTTQDQSPDTSLPTVTLGGQPDIRAALPDIQVSQDTNRTLPDSSDAKNKLNNAGKEGPKGPPQSKGKGGSGSGGGQGSGTGPGKGSGSGPGEQGSIRHARNKRWTMTFSTVGGNDYLRQLSTLGAVLIAEFPDGSRTMYRKLDSRPVPGEPIDQDVFNRMVWVDNRAQAVAELSEAMGIEQRPSAIAVYFPIKIEAELLRLELSYHGKKEEEILSTTFRVYSQGGSYRIIVTEQRNN